MNVLPLGMALTFCGSALAQDDYPQCYYRSMKPHGCIETSVASYVSATLSRDLVTESRQRITRRWLLLRGTGINHASPICYCVRPGVEIKLPRNIACACMQRHRSSHNSALRLLARGRMVHQLGESLTLSERALERSYGHRCHRASGNTGCPTQISKRSVRKYEVLCI